MAKIQDPEWNAWTDKFLSLKGGDDTSKLTEKQIDVLTRIHDKNFEG